MHRFIGQFDLTQSTLRLTDSELFNQIKNVLHLQTNEQIVLCNGKGKECIAKINAFAPGNITVTLEAQNETPTSPRPVVLYCAILKKENFEWVAQKATEVGIAEIIPLHTKRTVKLNIREDRLKKIMKEAAEQSGRGEIPRLGTIMKLAEAFRDARRNTENYFFDASGTSLPTKTNHASCGIFIGPEGGWDVSEIAAARAAGCTVASLGPLTLRAETAAIIASYRACNNF